MDENTKDVLLALFAVIGPLVGVWLGQRLEAGREDRHRFDDAKRAAYARFRVLNSEASMKISDIWKTGKNPRETGELRSGFLAELREVRADVELLGSPTVQLRATAVTDTIGEYLDDADGRKRVGAALDAFVDAAREDLGAPPLHRHDL